MPLRPTARLLVAPLALAAPAAAQTPAAVLEGELPDQSLGAALAIAGDLDGDGLAELAVGAPGRESASTQTVGLVHLVSGADGGVLGTATGALAGTELGAALAPAPDLGGDGVGDLVVGAPAGGRVVALDGAALAAGVEVELWSAGGPTFDDLGRAVVAVDDLDGDGVPDVAAGEPLHDVQAPGSNDGRVVLLSGADGAVLGTVDGPDDDDAAFGWSLALVADLDGDGLRELAVGAPFADGAAALSGAVHVVSLASASITATLAGERAGGQLGFALAAGPPQAEGGAPTLVVGEPASEPDTGVGRVAWVRPSDLAVLRWVRGTEEDGAFGTALAVGPASRGALPVAVGEPRARIAGADEGVVHLVDLSTGEVAARWNGPEAESGFGAALAWFAASAAARAGRLTIGAPEFDAEGEADAGRAETYDAAVFLAGGGPRLWSSARVAPAGAMLSWRAALDPVHGGATAVLLGSAAGTTPGFVVDGVAVPLVPDAYLATLVADVVDGKDEVAAVVTVEPTGEVAFGWTPPAGAGATLHHALVVLDPRSGAVVDVTGAIPLELE